MRTADLETGIGKRLLELGRSAAVVARELDAFEADLTDLHKGLGKGDLLVHILRGNPLVESVELKRDLAGTAGLAATSDATGSHGKRRARSHSTEKVST